MTLKMKIDIVVNNTHKWGPEDLVKGTLNGSEEMVVKLAESLANRGHDVLVACTLNGMSRTLHNVRYVNNIYYARDMLPANNTYLIAFKCPEAMIRDGYIARFLWTADPASLKPVERLACNYMFGISPWHETELKGINHGFESISHIEPGFDPILSRRPKVTGKWKQRTDLQCLYASSHDRGLYDLFDMWNKILVKVPKANLLVTYSAPNKNIIPPSRVHHLGRISEVAMADLYKSSDLLLYPCTGGERFCLTALRAQYYGCIPVVVPKMALKDTVQYGIKVRKEKFAEKTVKLLLDKEYKANIRSNMLQRLRFATWEETASIWEEILIGKGKSSGRAI